MSVCLNVFVILINCSPCTLTRRRSRRSSMHGDWISEHLMRCRLCQTYQLSRTIFWGPPAYCTVSDVYLYAKECEGCGCCLGWCVCFSVVCFGLRVVTSCDVECLGWGVIIEFNQETLLSEDFLQAGQSWLGDAQVCQLPSDHGVYQEEVHRHYFIPCYRIGHWSCKKIQVTERLQKIPQTRDWHPSGIYEVANCSWHMSFFCFFVLLFWLFV